MTEDIPNFEVRVLYDGNGAFIVDEITISKDASYLSAWMIVLFLLFAALDSCLAFSEVLLFHKETILVLSGIFLVSCLPLFLPGFHKGHDTVFHLLRIDGIAQELHNGQFPVRMPSVWIDGYGFPVSIFYRAFCFACQFARPAVKKAALLLAFTVQRWIADEPFSFVLLYFRLSLSHFFTSLRLGRSTMVSSKAPSMMALRPRAPDLRDMAWAAIARSASSSNVNSISSSDISF